MNRSTKILLGVAAILVCAAVNILNPILPTPEAEHSASLYQAGSFGISSEPIDLIGSSRRTNPNGDFERLPARELNGFIWYPETREQKPFPLIVYSHGFMSSVSEAEYLADFLVPRGYVVVAVDYPLSSGGAPGGPDSTDVINQPGDVSFVIDAMLTRNDDQGDSLYGLLDPSRIAAVGLSLGGLTTQLVAFHQELRDEFASENLGAAVTTALPLD